jgi:FMN phosphatase YigB (HAD superfamily)
LELYQTLPVFSDVERSLRSLSEKYRVFAFSNGRPEEVRSVLAHGKIEQFFIGIISAHEVRSFKPNPAVYAHARRVSGAWSSPFWVVSSNPWDVIGARCAGLSAAWVQRSDKKIFDPWGIDPSLIVHSLSELNDLQSNNTANVVGLFLQSSNRATKGTISGPVGCLAPTKTIAHRRPSPSLSIRPGLNNESNRRQP